MNQINILVEKRTYIIPHIELIKLDNEISLALESDVNPDGEPTFSQVQDYISIDPFKTNIT